MDRTMSSRAWLFGATLMVAAQACSEGGPEGGKDGAGGTSSGRSGSSAVSSDGGGGAFGGSSSQSSTDGGSSSHGTTSSSTGSSSSAAVHTSSSSSSISGASSSSGTGSSSSGGITFPPNCTCLKLGPPACTPTGHVTYTLARATSPTADEASAYDAISCAMDGAVAYYNCYTAITKKLNVSYNPGVPTADGNINGSIRFGGTSYMECVTAMHEIAHTVGIGTASNWSTYSVGGVFTGSNATAELRAITGTPTDTLHSDTQHFWPYGLNYASEAKSTADLVDHCRMVTAIRKDLGL